MIQFFLVYLIIFQIVSQAQLNLQPQNWIYSPQYSYKVEAQGEQSQFSQIEVSPITGLIFIAAGDSGVIVLDPLQEYSQIAKAKSTDNIICFCITNDGTTLFMSNNARLTIYDFSSRSEFVQIAQYPETLYIMEIIINSAEDTLFIFQIDGNVQIIDISNKTSPTAVGSIMWYPQQIYGGLLTPDGKFLLLCQNNQGLGVFSIQKQSGQVTGVLVGSYSGIGNSHNVILTPDLKYVINLDQRNGLSFGDFTVVTSAAPISYPLQLTYYLNSWWPSQVIVPSPYSFCITTDGNFLFLGVRSIGIYTIDLTNKNKPQTYMWSYFPFHGISIALSPDIKFLYFSNAKSFMAFRRMTPILGLKYANLYNGLQSKGFDKSDTKYYWRCDYDPNKQVYLGAFNTDGLWFIDVQDPTNFNVLTKQYKPPGSTSSNDVFYAINNYSVLITSMNDGVNFLAVLDISDYKHIKVIQQVPYGETVTTYVKDIDNNIDNTMIVVSMDRTIVFVDITTLGSYKIIAKWTFQSNMKGFTTGVMISWDNKHFIGACRGYGYFVLDISDLTNIQLVNYQDSTGSEQVYKSLTYSSQYYLVDGLDGLYIMDQTKLPEFVQFSQLVVNGWTNDITFLNQEDTVIISTMQQGMIYLLDISENTHPFIVSNYEFGLQNGMFTCAKQDFSSLFINNNIEVRIFPMTISVFIHTDYLIVLGYSSKGDMLFETIDNPDSYQFLVGQTIKLNTCMLYQPLDLVVSSVTLYQKQTQYPLPYWIIYNPVEISLMVTLTNGAVDPLNLDKPLLNTIVFTTLRPLYINDFEYTQSDCATNVNQAQSIYIQFQEDGIIDQNNLVSPNLTFNDNEVIQLRDTIQFPNSTPEQQSYNQCVNRYLKQSLLSSIQLTPIYLSIYPSLFLNITQQNDSYIQTPAQNASIEIDIPKFSGKFIFENVVSISIQINEDMNTLNIQGLISNLNQFLNRKIIIFPIPPMVYSAINVTVTVNDQMNYPVSKSLPATQFPFLVEKQHITVNPNNKLQSQFSDNIEILTLFGFSISPTTFIVPDFNTTLSYTALVEKGGKFMPFDNTDWLQYNKESQKFFGTPPQNTFQTSVTVQVTGSDGYTSISDTFTIHVNQLPVMFVIQWIVTILGPLTGVLGLYKSRSTIYNICYRKKNRYSICVCKPKELFVLKIPLILTEQRASIQIVTELLKIMSSKDQQHPSTNQSSKSQHEDDQAPDNNERTSKKKKTIERFKRLATQVAKGVGKIQEMIAFDVSSVAAVFRKRIQDIKKKQTKQLIEKLYLKENGQINYEQYRKDIMGNNIKFKLSSAETTTSQEKEQLENVKSLLSECLRFQLARKLLSCDLKSFTVYSFLRQYCTLSSNQVTQNDWYKYIVDLEYTDDLTPQGHTIPFPNFTLHFIKFTKGLQLLTIINQQEIQSLLSDKINNLIKDQIFASIYREGEGVNLHLIEEVLYADAAGVLDDSPSVLFPCSGESIYIDPHEISSLVAMRYAPGSIPCCESTLGLDYKRYGPQGNMQLPSWLTLEIEPGLLILKGIPELQNIEDILIRIYTIDGYIIRHFILKVDENQAVLKKIIEEEKSRRSSSNIRLKQKGSSNYSDYHNDSTENFRKGSKKQSTLINKKLGKPSIFQHHSSLTQSSSLPCHILNSNCEGDLQLKDIILEMGDQIQEEKSDKITQQSQLILDDKPIELFDNEEEQEEEQEEEDRDKDKEERKQFESEEKNIFMKKSQQINTEDRDSGRIIEFNHKNNGSIIHFSESEL